MFDMNKNDQWRWKLMITQPAFITKSMVGKAIEELQQQKNGYQREDSITGSI